MKSVPSYMLLLEQQVRKCVAHTTRLEVGLRLFLVPDFEHGFSGFPSIATRIRTEFKFMSTNVIP